REGASEAPAQLGVDARGHALERDALGGLGLRQAALPRAPLVDRGVEAHRDQASEARRAARAARRCPAYGPFGRCLTTYERSPGRTMPRRRASRSSAAGLRSASRRARSLAFSCLSRATSARRCLASCTVDQYERAG